MIDPKKVFELERTMRGRREEILDLHDSLQSSMTSLYERENELEEMAGKEIILEDVDRMDERALEELGKIDAALAKIQNGGYGRCDTCKRPIGARRLQAIPWTSVCKRCALNREAGRIPETEEDDSFEDVSMNDNELVEALWDALDGKADLNLADLQIDSIDGTIRMTGSVPTERDHQQILETIEEELGYEDVIDRIGIEESDRRIYDANEDDEDYEKERVMNGEAAEDDLFVAMEENRSVIPPETMMAEDDR